MSAECLLLPVNQCDGSPVLEAPEDLEPLLTGSVHLVTEPQLTEEEDSFTDPQLNEGDDSVTEALLTESVDSVTEPQLTDGEDSFTDPQLTGSVDSVTEPQLTRSVDSFTEPQLTRSITDSVIEPQLTEEEVSYYEFDGVKIEVLNVVIESLDGNETEAAESKKIINNSLAVQVNSVYKGKRNKQGVDNSKMFSLGSDSFVDSKVNINRGNYRGNSSDNCNLKVKKSKIFSKTAVRKHLCPHCPSRFTIVYNRDRHVKTEHDGLRYECLKCHLQFTSNSNLTRHIRLSHKKVQCSRCSEIFQTEDARAVHTCEGSNHQSSVPITCDRCPCTFSSRFNLNKHVRVAHDGIVYACPVCGRSFRSRENVVEHTRSIHSLFLCTKCDKLSNTEAEFVDHVNLLHHTIIEPLKNRGSKVCGVPKRKFKTKPDVAQVKCDQCDKMFSSARYLKVHIQTQHIRKHWSCKYCSESFSSKTLLTSHVDSCHQDLYYLCPMCVLQFSQRASLSQHMWTLHAKILPPVDFDGNENCQCEVCGKTFLRDANLKRHRKNEHDFIPHPCDLCTSTFRTKKLARDHRVVEHKGQPFICTDCPTHVTFRTRIELRKHTLSTHRKPSSYACSICVAGFLRRSLLSEHHRDFHENMSSIPESVPVVAIVDDKHDNLSEENYNLPDLEAGDLLAQAAKSAGIDDLSTELWSYS